MPKPKPWSSDRDAKNKRYQIVLDLRLPHLEVSLTFGAKKTISAPPTDEKQISWKWRSNSRLHESTAKLLS